MISTPLRIEKPVRRPIVPPIRPKAASVVTLQVVDNKQWSMISMILDANVLSEQKSSRFNLNIPFNLVIGRRVKEDVHLLQCCVLYDFS